MTLTLLKVAAPAQTCQKCGGPVLIPFGPRPGDCWCDGCWWRLQELTEAARPLPALTAEVVRLQAELNGIERRLETLRDEREAFNDPLSGEEYDLLQDEERLQDQLDEADERLVRCHAAADALAEFLCREVGE